MRWKPEALILHVPQCPVFWAFPKSFPASSPAFPKTGGRDILAFYRIGRRDSGG